jgi:hypothetical protein
MPHILSCYYLDQALDDEELQFVARTLIGPWARFKTGAQELRQVRVPAVLPLPDEDGAYAESREQRAHRVCLNLHHAGIRADAGKRVVWVTPQDADWDAIFQFAIREETGFAPFVAQRWFPQDGVLVRGKLRVVDADMLLRGLES